MATNLTRFEIVLPSTQQGTSQYDAVQQFITNVLTLCPLVRHQAMITDQQGNDTYQTLLYGLITTAQQATALGYLNTLNAALGKNVLCTVNAVTSEP